MRHRCKKLSIVICAQVEILSKNEANSIIVDHHLFRKLDNEFERTTNRLMHRNAVSNLLATSSEIGSRLPSDCRIHYRTFCNVRFISVLNKPAKKLRLSEKNRRDRLAFCLCYRHWVYLLCGSESCFRINDNCPVPS